MTGNPETLQPDESTRISSPTLFLDFSQMALMGFGGVMPFAYRVLVEKRHWVRTASFPNTWRSARCFPGPTICNMAILVGWRFNGLSGAIACFCRHAHRSDAARDRAGPGLCQRGHPSGRAACLGGMSAVAAGLVISTAVKMALGLRESGTPHAPAIALAALFALLAFIGVGLLRWPLILVALGLAPLAIVAAWLQLRKPDAE